LASVHTVGEGEGVHADKRGPNGNEYQNGNHCRNSSCPLGAGRAATKRPVLVSLSRSRVSVCIKLLTAFDFCGLHPLFLRFQRVGDRDDSEPSACQRWTRWGRGGSLGHWTTGSGSALVAEYQQRRGPFRHGAERRSVYADSLNFMAALEKQRGTLRSRRGLGSSSRALLVPPNKDAQSRKKSSASAKRQVTVQAGYQAGALSPPHLVSDSRYGRLHGLHLLLKSGRPPTAKPLHGADLGPLNSLQLGPDIMGIHRHFLRGDGRACA
jgi:hypothetical protein